MPPEGFEGLFQLPQTADARARLLESVVKQYTPWQRAVQLTGELYCPLGRKEEPYRVDLAGVRDIGAPNPDIPFYLLRLETGLAHDWNGTIYYAWGFTMDQLPPRPSGPGGFDIIFDEYVEREFEMSAKSNLVLLRDRKSWRNIRDLVEINGLIRVEPELEEDEVCVKLGSTLIL